MTVITVLTVNKLIQDDKAARLWLTRSV